MARQQNHHYEIFEWISKKYQVNILGPPILHGNMTEHSWESNIMHCGILFTIPYSMKSSCIVLTRVHTYQIREVYDDSREDES